MINSVLIVSFLMWLVLATAVGVHAEGHDRSGAIWFTFIGLTGIFGVAIYLLAITSAKSGGFQSNPKKDKEFESDVSIFKKTSTILLGFLGGSSIAYAFIILISNIFPMMPGPGPLYQLILLTGLVGATGGSQI